MKQWNFFGLTAIVLLIPVLFIYYNLRNGAFLSATGIPFYRCNSSACRDLPKRNYKTIELPLKSREGEIKVRNEIRRLGQIQDTIHGYHFELNDFNLYEDFIKGIDLGYSSGVTSVIYNDYGLWIYYPSEGENKAYMKKLRKECPELGEPRTCK